MYNFIFWIMFIEVLNERPVQVVMEKAKQVNMEPLSDNPVM